MKSHFNQSGIVLLTTLILTSLLALLILTQMQLFLLNFKALRLLKEKHQAFWSLEAAASKLMQDLDGLRKGSCVLGEQGPNIVIDLLKNKQSCSLIYEKEVFYYLIEDLGIFPCLQIQFNKEKYSTRHFRLSIHSAKKKRAILQVRHARLANLIRCEKELKPGKTGLLSWRYFNY
ncbi:MAG: hypothetical protein H0U73_06850 [Tatlockia sp.]|nr:hypothetical protein [Tatlockia sp.]